MCLARCVGFLYAVRRGSEGSNHIELSQSTQKCPLQTTVQHKQSVPCESSGLFRMVCRMSSGWFALDEVRCVYPSMHI